MVVWLKRVAYSSKRIDHVIKIVLELNAVSEDQEIAASNRDGQQLFDDSDIYLSEFNNFIGKILDLLDKLDYSVVNQNRSKNDASLSYYIEFFAHGQTKDKIHILVELRISDHFISRLYSQYKTYKHYSNVAHSYHNEAAAPSLVNQIIINRHDFTTYLDAFKYLNEYLATIDPEILHRSDHRNLDD